LFSLYRLEGRREGTRKEEGENVQEQLKPGTMGRENASLLIKMTGPTALRQTGLLKLQGSKYVG